MNTTKKLFEITLAIILLCLLLIPSIFICFIIYIQTKQFPIFIQMRGLTLNNYCFRIYKFRTLKNSNQNSVYPLGKFLRRTGLDEIPQLINIIKGEMRFIGPRPLDFNDLLEIKKRYNDIHLEREKINLKPGLTGWWQVNRIRNSGIKHLIDSDKYYFNNCSLSLDISILVRTLYILFKGRNRGSILIGTTSTYKLLSLDL